MLTFSCRCEEEFDRRAFHQRVNGIDLRISGSAFQNKYLLRNSSTLSGDQRSKVTLGVCVCFQLALAVIWEHVFQTNVHFLHSICYLELLLLCLKNIMKITCCFQRFCWFFFFFIIFKKMISIKWKLFHLWIKTQIGTIWGYIENYFFSNWAISIEVHHPGQHCPLTIDQSLTGWQ